MGSFFCEIAKQATAKNVVIITRHSLRGTEVNVNFLMGSLIEEIDSHLA